MKKILAMAMAAMVAGCGADRGKMTLAEPRVTTTTTLDAYTNLYLVAEADSVEDEMTITMSGEYDISLFEPTYNLTFSCAGGEITICTTNGAVTFSEGMSLDDAAQGFWLALSGMYPNMFPCVAVIATTTTTTTTLRNETVLPPDFRMDVSDKGLYHWVDGSGWRTRNGYKTKEECMVYAWSWYDYEKKKAEARGRTFTPVEQDTVIATTTTATTTTGVVDWGPPECGGGYIVITPIDGTARAFGLADGGAVVWRKLNMTTVSTTTTTTTTLPW